MLLCKCSRGKPLYPERILLLFALCATVLCFSCNRNGKSENPPETREQGPIQYVDPFIGTKGPGNVIPGPSLPHAMVKLSPDTNAEPGSIDAYEYSDDKIQGFSHTHLEGPGGSANGYSHLLLIPTTGEVRTSEKDYASAYSHAEETAGTGYYSVRLQDYGTLAELTSTMHCGFHRYTFPEAEDAHILLDVGHTRGLSLGGHVEILGDRTVRGYGIYSMHPVLALVTLPDPGTTARIRVWFHAEFDRPFTSWGTWQGSIKSPGSLQASGAGVGAWVDYGTEADERVQVRVGISFVSAQQAQENLSREIPGWDFTAIRKKAEDTWNEQLGRIEVYGGTEEERVTFYTALYHSLLQPTDYTEYGRFWSGADGTGGVFEDETLRFFSDDWCVWDTFRTTHPLQVLLEPETRSHVVQSFVHLYEQGGWLPKCTWQATGYSRVMIGNHATGVILDAYVKGLRGFDVDKAYAAMRKSATQDNPNIASSFLCGYLNLGTPPEYIALGYVPQECDPTQSVSMTLEYAYNDWCLAMMAQALGKTDDYEYFLQRSANYIHHWNPETGFMQPRDGDGDWIEPFDPENESGFCEADSWKYTWFVPHDPQGLVELMGGPEPFLQKLDAFFDQGHYDPSNEPGFHVPYLYVYAGAAYKTQKKVRELLKEAFTAEPSGLPGNDDAGATSAWYVFSAMGLYPVCPGDPAYILTAPAFPKVVIHLDPVHHRGKSFVIEARNNSEDNLYIQSATLNGKQLDRAWLLHDEIVQGGRLVLEMGHEPSAWGCGPGNLPPRPALQGSGIRGQGLIPAP